MRILPFIAALLIACSGNGGGRAPKAALPADTPTQAGHSTLPRDTVTQSLSATALSMERQGMVNATTQCHCPLHGATGNGEHPVGRPHNQGESDVFAT